MKDSYCTLLIKNIFKDPALNVYTLLWIVENSVRFYNLLIERDFWEYYEFRMQDHIPAYAFAHSMLAYNLFTYI